MIKLIIVWLEPWPDLDDVLFSKEDERQTWFAPMIRDWTWSQIGIPNTINSSYDHVDIDSS